MNTVKLSWAFLFVLIFSFSQSSYLHVMAQEVKCVVLTPTPDLQKSLDFYKKLNYKVLSDSDPAVVTDGNVVIQINPERQARAGVRLYKADWSKELDAVKEYTQAIEKDGEFVLADPSGVYVYLSTEEPTDWDDAQEDVEAIPGKFMGLSLESLNFEQSVGFWQALGFEQSTGAADQGWIVLSNGSAVGISLMKSGMCPHLFFNPSFTYFNGKENNPKIIEKIRKSGVEITEEITAFNEQGIVDNIIIRDPGGFGYFIFND